MTDVFQSGDDLGPTKTLYVYEPRVGLRAILVVDNVARGPSLGGIRMAADVSLQECRRLARAMTLKNAAADLPHGGGKAVLFGDPKCPREQKELLIRALAQALRDIKEYILAPDMGTDEQCMAWIKDEIGRVVGLPREIGGIPLDEIGATGFGIGHVAEEAMHYCEFPLQGARVAVQGFGAVGMHAARYLSEKGCVLVGVADTGGTLVNPKGLDVARLAALKAQGKSVVDYADGDKRGIEAIIAVECDIWIPAARPDVIHADNVHKLHTRLIIEGANIPITHEAEKTLHEKGVLCVPDFIANAGGVICAAMEYTGASEAAAFSAIEEKLRRNTAAVLHTVTAEHILPREAAVQLAMERVHKAMSYRRWNIF